MADSSKFFTLNCFQSCLCFFHDRLLCLYTQWNLRTLLFPSERKYKKKYLENEENNSFLTCVPDFTRSFLLVLNKAFSTKKQENKNFIFLQVWMYSFLETWWLHVF